MVIVIKVHSRISSFSWIIPVYIPKLRGVVIFKILTRLDLLFLGKIETKSGFLTQQGRLRSMHSQVGVKSNLTISHLKSIQGPGHRSLNPMWPCLMHFSDLLFFCCFPCQFQGLHKNVMIDIIIIDSTSENSKYSWTFLKTGIWLNSVSNTEYQLNYMNTFPNQEKAWHCKSRINH